MLAHEHDDRENYQRHDEHTTSDEQPSPPGQTDHAGVHTPRDGRTPSRARWALYRSIASISRCRAIRPVAPSAPCGGCRLAVTGNTPHPQSPHTSWHDHTRERAAGPRAPRIAAPPGASVFMDAPVRCSSDPAFCEPRRSVCTDTRKEGGCPPPEPACCLWHLAYAGVAPGRTRTFLTDIARCLRLRRRLMP